MKIKSRENKRWQGPPHRRVVYSVYSVVKTKRVCLFSLGHYNFKHRLACIQSAGGKISDKKLSDLITNTVRLVKQTLVRRDEFYQQVLFQSCQTRTESFFTWKEKHFLTPNLNIPSYFKSQHAASEVAVRWSGRHRSSSLTFSLSASGEVHLTGSLAVSCMEEASLVRPKSLTLAMLSSDTSTLRAARSLWTKLLASRYSMASHTSLGVTARRERRWARMTEITTTHRCASTS